ncbi:DNA-3-methyladenine glycosylase I [Nocardioides jishulii]|uniref:DNA-3-methyladenine glycosylase I n=1 Tax=Nocardioides jishulii TaxID=2575440 RepID=A0A4U2YSG4_9ACTN|nr:DNA-3-methyladenine glycosylase I [Nocardioides jishulii]QCX28641.1 DNA-3-methyladenine glycosylase I [Nocardioides jishulii]TKI64466.1 DNA-3-methyladenine glycosylase I [Nocardioides jishulii]
MSLPTSVVGDDGLARCPWAVGDELMRDYHDTEWGVRVHGEARWFERLTLEAFQSGLSWRTILAKRPAFRELFADFDADVVAAFTEADVERLMADARIVRNRRKVDATLVNARAVVALRSGEGLEELLLSHAPTREVVPQAETTSAESVALSKALKARGFTFVGPTTMYALMEAGGLFDPHLPDCHRRGARVGRGER